MIEFITQFGNDYQNMTIGKMYKATKREQYWTTVLDDNNEEFELPKWMFADV